MSVYDAFKTDTTLEKSGIEIDYGKFKVTVARAGGGNQRFKNISEAVTKPYRRMIQTETLPEERSQEILREVYAKAVVLNWHVKDKNGDFVQGVDFDEAGAPVPFTVENVIKVFTDFPDIFTDIQDQASKASLFRAVMLEEEAKNS
jgi:hypothetical protein